MSKETTVDRCQKMKKEKIKSKRKQPDATCSLIRGYWVFSGYLLITFNM